MTAGIVGLGLIGGSLAKAYHEAGERVLAHDIDRDVLSFAVISGAVDEALTDETMAECDVILLAVRPAAAVEWLKNHERIPTEVYDKKYFKHFDPDLYDPALWADAAAEAGMKYFVITTKHHEGFCLWDSKYTDYKSTNTPYGKDILTPMVDAFRSKGLRTGFYHSLLDWHHPDYTVDECHPMRDNAEYIAKDPERHLERYVEYLHNQTEELLRKYDPVDIIWFDFSVGGSNRFPGKGKNEWHSEEFIKMIRSINPKIMIDDRLQIGRAHV